MRDFFTRTLLNPRNVLRFFGHRKPDHHKHAVRGAFYLRCGDRVFTPSRQARVPKPGRTGA